MKLENPIQMAVIGAPHGIAGELRVKTFTGDPLALGDYGPLYAADGRKFTVAGIRPSKNVVVVRFREIADRTAAEAATGIELFVDRSVLPDDLEADEFYHADLIGLPVRDETGEEIGRVEAFHDFGAGDVMEVRLSTGRTVLVPFTAAAVPAVDLDAGIVSVETVAAGLAETDDDEETDEAEAGRRFDRAKRPRGPRDAGGNR